MSVIEDLKPERLSRAFSTAVFRELAREIPAHTARESIARVARLGETNGASLGDTFEHAHRLMTSGYRNEYIFKNELVSKIVFGRHSTRTASALLELRMGKSWADVMIVNGTSTTYEIKTDLDQFGRLSTQLADYSSRSEFVNLVTSDARAAAAEKYLPAHVGIVALRRNGALRTVRSATSNFERMHSVDLYSVLRADEALTILTNLTGYALDVPPGRAWNRLRELFAGLPLVEAHTGMVGQLRRRGIAASQLSSSPGFPPSLRALAFGTNLSVVGRERVLRRLASPATLALEGCYPRWPSPS